MSIRPKVEGVLAEAAERVKQLDRNARQNDSRMLINQE